VPKYDVESFRDDIINLIKDNLDSKINEINLEKSDSNNISLVAAENYYNDINDQVLNANPFVHYGVLTAEPIGSVGIKTSLEVTIFVYVFIDMLNAVGAETKVLRYIRALSEVIQCDFKKFRASLSIVQRLPAIVQHNGSDFKVGGINITGTFA
jgi:hypothetical protein